MIPLPLLNYSRRLFPTETATITIHRRPWWTGIILSHAYATEWCGAYRSR